VRAEERLDGKYLLSTSDPDLSAEDVALGYKNLLEAERGFRDMKSTLDLRPVYHRIEPRIRAHVLLCWLALLLIRVAERRTGLTWRRIAIEMGRIHTVTLTGTAGTVTHFVSAMGTTGTIMGVSRFLKERNRAITIVGCQPAEGASIPGIRRWSAAYLPKFYEPSRVDCLIDITQRDAEDTTRRLVREIGLFTGPSSGGACWAALQLARNLDHGVIVFIACDRGDRYLSADLFR